jgi:multidrug efflux system membrane fusion protein
MLIAVAVAMLMAGSGCGTREIPPPPPTPVKIQAVTAYTGAARARYSANIQAERQVSLAFKSAGYVQMLLQVPGVDGHLRDVQEGDRVRRGTVLARVRDAEYVAQVEHAAGQLAAAEQSREAAVAQLAEARASRAQAAAQLVVAKAAAEKAGFDMDRATKLYTAQSMTKVDYDQLKAQFDQTSAQVDAATAQIANAEAAEQEGHRKIGMAEGQIAAARASLDQSRVQLADTALVAPMDALILKRSVESGDFAQVGTVGFTLAEVGTVKVVFGVPDVVVANLTLGRAQAITAQALPGATLQGRITRIAPSADPQSRTFEVEVSVPNPQDRLKVGGIASLALGQTEPAQEALAVPLTAVVRDPDRPNAFAVLVAEGAGDTATARLRPVELGDTYGNMITVLKGVTRGERVLTTGATYVKSGDKVRIIP